MYCCLVFGYVFGARYMFSDEIIFAVPTAPWSFHFDTFLGNRCRYDGFPLSNWFSRQPITPQQENHNCKSFWNASFFDHLRWERMLLKKIDSRRWPIACSKLHEEHFDSNNTRLLCDYNGIQSLKCNWQNGKRAFGRSGSPAEIRKWSHVTCGSTKLLDWIASELLSWSLAIVLLC